MDAPCRGCPDRYPACHDHCQKYQQWLAEFRVRTAERRKEMHLESSLNQYKFDFRCRMNKRRIYRRKHRKPR